MAEEAAVPENCFAENLRQHTRRQGSLAWRVFGELGLLILIPTLALLVAYFAPQVWGRPTPITLMTMLKITSICFLGYHTVENTPEPIYKQISLWMMGTISLLFLIIYRENCSSEALLCQLPKNGLVFELITILSFVYMVVFLIFNVKIVRIRNDVGTKVFIDAFIYAVSIPSLLALFSIVVIYHVILGGNDESFLHGATTFLVLISSASSICVDHYGRMFLLPSRPCIRSPASVAKAGGASVGRTGGGGQVDPSPPAKQPAKKISASPVKNGTVDTKG